MSFVFVSHAQADKTRPDGRMRALIHYLNDAGIPLWIDRPEEIGLDARGLEDRCVTLNGTWTADILDALARCKGGIGVWSHHSAHRLKNDPGGVLYQELNGLNTRKQLVLLKIDADAPEPGATLGRLGEAQQYLDLAAGRDAFRRRVARLVEHLGQATGVNPKYTRPYVEAVSAADGQGGGLGDIMNPARKSARTSAQALLDAFSRDDPGRIPARLSPQLADGLARQIEACRQANVRFRAFHRLIAVMHAPSRFAQTCFDELEAGLGARMEKWLSQQAETHQTRQQEKYLPVALDRDEAAAAAIAEAEGSQVIDERTLMLAILKDQTSGTVASMTKSLGPDAMQRLLRIVATRRPQMPDFQRTQSLGPID